jgi:hypothetical protein
MVWWHYLLSSIQIALYSIFVWDSLDAASVIRSSTMIFDQVFTFNLPDYATIRVQSNREVSAAGTGK